MDTRSRFIHLKHAKTRFVFNGLTVLLFVSFNLAYISNVWGTAKFCLICSIEIHHVFYQLDCYDIFNLNEWVD